MIIRIRLFIAFLICTSIVCSSGAEGTQVPVRFVDPGIVAYGVPGTNLAEMYDLGKGHFWVQDKRRALLGIMDTDTEFGGTLESCGTETVQCLDWSRIPSLPKVFPFPSNWESKNQKCKLLSSEYKDSADLAWGECLLMNGAILTFQYSTRRGIQKIRRICPKCRPEEIYLLTQKGFYAPP